MQIGSLFSALFAGVIIGMLGRVLAPGRHRLGVILTILVGIVGAVLGSAAAAALHRGFWITLVFQVVIAALLVSVFSSRRR
jgi:uncharacterized membrane protein YeaQ/YmgE (transglycosylase-associated protein family)